ncbi:adenine phosphoribosyltransferase [bacterium]|nr:adenine phosphoribosyltransferase [bacterium]
MMDLAKIIRDVPDFPKKGIIFKDITTLLNNKSALKKVIDEFINRYKNKSIDYVVAIESRGFIFGGAIAFGLGAGFVPLRKPKKLPYKTISETYQLEYGQDCIEIHKDAFPIGSKILLMDDLLATGGTMAAAANLVKKLEGKIVEIAFLIELEFLHGKDKLKDYPTYSMIKF